MIYVEIRGNLGNQLFEYGLARSLQEITGQKITLLTSSLAKYNSHLNYEFHLNDYVLNDNVLIDEISNFPRIINTYRWPLKPIKKVFPNLVFSFFSMFGVYLWLKSTYKRIKIRKRKNYYISGYWQSSKYFSNVEGLLKKEFSPKAERLEKNRDLYKAIEENESVCVTIRRGDYISNERFKKIFYMCDEAYFEKAIGEMKKRVQNPAFIFFSDDIEWVKENIKVDGQAFYEAGDDPVWEKLRLMSLCKHFIISNSSFSWWAQHLSTNTNKIVVAPSSWYPDNRKCDIYEDGWIYLE